MTKQRQTTKGGPKMAPAAPDRDKALELALAQIDKQFGKGSVMKMGEKGSMVVETISTGALALDRDGFAALVEGVKAGQKLAGWIMDQDKDIQVVAKSDIPIGHKLAIKPLDNGATVIKYGVDIGKVVQPIRKGEHAHVHNIKTKRW